MDPQVAFKNFIVAALFLGVVGFAALIFQSGSTTPINGTIGQGSGGSWGGGESHEGDDDD